MMVSSLHISLVCMLEVSIGKMKLYFTAKPEQGNLCCGCHEIRPPFCHSHDSLHDGCNLLKFIFLLLQVIRQGGRDHVSIHPRKQLQANISCK